MSVDAVIILLYFILINYLGIRFSKAGNLKDYFLGNRRIPWIAACFSIVATETSTLTFISVPGLAYIKGMGFIQITFGYLIGRILVAVILLPQYFKGNIETTYEFLQKRFGISSRRAISIVFHITRLLADSVRLFAAAIPLSILTGIDYRLSILIIGAATFFYTYYGGIASVVIVDSVQLFLYIISAFIGIYMAVKIIDLPFDNIIALIPHERIRLFSSGFENGIGGIFTSYNIFSGLIGGAFLSFASHGTDHLIVQRILSCRDLSSARKAIITSGVLVIFQFFVFLFLGLLIMVLLKNRIFAKPDEIMPYFIINYMPPGLRGLMLAGIFAAAMSTLSSSINSLSASTSIDLLGIDRKKFTDRKKVKISRYISLFWTGIIVLISTALSDNKSPLVELGLGIASITYGGMLGIFMQGILLKKISDRAAVSGVIVSIAAVLITAKTLNIFWPWFIPIGFSVSFISGAAINKLLEIYRKSGDINTD